MKHILSSIHSTSILIYFLICDLRTATLHNGVHPLPTAATHQSFIHVPTQPDNRLLRVQLIDIHLLFHFSQVDFELDQFFKDHRGERLLLFEVLKVLGLHLSRCVGLHVSRETG